MFVLNIGLCVCECVQYSCSLPFSHSIPARIFREWWSSPSRNATASLWPHYIHTHIQSHTGISINGTTVCVHLEFHNFSLLDFWTHEHNDTVMRFFSHVALGWIQLMCLNKVSLYLYIINKRLNLEYFPSVVIKKKKRVRIVYLFNTNTCNQSLYSLSPRHPQ